MRLVVDEENRVRMAQHHDPDRMPPELHCPQVIDQRIETIVPEPQRHGLATLIRAARTSGRAHTWWFASVFTPGEWRLVHAYPAAVQHWVVLSVWWVS